MLDVDHVSKRYRLHDRPWKQLVEKFPGGPKPREFWALRDVTLRVERGEFFGIVGPNGSGKSTLLQIIAGVLSPTEGEVRCQGRIAALLELGAGFNPEFTGRENVRLSSEILGLSRAEIDERLPRIEEFAGIGEFMERPVKEYSSGMYVRLAFSAAIHVDPELLIVDEALAVGDAIFANRCIRKFEELRERGVTVVFVSHDLGVVKRLCDRVLLLWNGRMEMLDEPPQVVNRYVGMVLERQPAESPKSALAGSHRHGDGTTRIEQVEILPSLTLRADEPMTARIRLRAHRDCPGVMVGVLIRTRLGIDVFGTNTLVEGTTLGAMTAGAEAEVDLTWPCLLAGGDYTLTVATQNEDGTSHDWVDDAISFTVVNSRQIAGVASLPVEIRIKRG